MKQLYFNPFFGVTDIGAAEPEFFSMPIYIAKIDNSRQVKATVTPSGTFDSISIAAKFVHSDTEGGSYTDVTGGGFAAITDATPQTITFTLGSNVHVGTQLANYGKWLKLSVAGTGGTTVNVDLVFTLENVFVPDDIVELRRDTIAV